MHLTVSLSFPKIHLHSRYAIKLWIIFPGTFICHEDESYIDENLVCDGKADCSVGRWRNTSDDELLYNCPEEMRESSNLFLLINFF